MSNKALNCITKVLIAVVTFVCIMLINTTVSLGQDCVRANPTLVIQSPNQSVLAGQQLTYKVTLTNNDSSACPASNFSIMPDFPRLGWTHTPICVRFTLAPGQSQTREVIIGSPSTACPIPQSFQEVAQNDSAQGFSATARAVFDIKGAIPGALSDECARQAANIQLPLTKGRVATVSWEEPSGSTRTSVFAVGADGHLLQLIKGPGEDGRWENHGAPPGTIVNSAPAAIVYRQDTSLRFHVFVAGLNGHLIERRLRSETEGEWIDHGVIPKAADSFGFVNTPVAVASDPAIITWEDNIPRRHISVFVKSSDGRMIERWTTDANIWSWVDREGIEIRNIAGERVAESFLGGGSPLAIVGQKDNFETKDNSMDFVTRIHVFMRGLEGNLLEGRGEGKDGGETVNWTWKNHVPVLKSPFLPSFLMFKFADVISDATGFAWPDAGDSKDARFNVFVAGKDKDTSEQLFLELIYDGKDYSWAGHIPDEENLKASTESVELLQDRPAVAVWGNLGPFGPPRGNPFGVEFRLFARTTEGNLVSYHRSDVKDPDQTGDFIVEDFPRCSRITMGVSPGMEPMAPFGPICSELGTTKQYFFNIFQLAAAPSVTGRQLSDGKLDFHVFANRANGTLIENRPERAGIFSWNTSHVPIDFIRIRNSADVRNKRCGEFSKVAAIFPAWVPVEDDSEGGFIAGNQPQVLEGIVVASRISREDLPFNHTHDLSRGAVPVVTHDWNIFVAPDIKYQHLLADSNFLTGGLMEVEWEQAPDKLPVTGLPGLGDRVWMQGQWIYDCGHPPPKTEIHPPSALSVIRSEPFIPGDFGLAGAPRVIPATRAVLTLSPNSGPVVFREDEKCPKLEETVGDKVGVLDILGFFVDVILKATGFRGDIPFPLSDARPADWCYTELNRPAKGVEFVLPLPPRPSADARPAIASRGGAMFMASPMPENDPTHYRVKLPDSSAPRALELAAHWVDLSNKPISSARARRLQVCYEVEELDILPGFLNTLKDPIIYLGANGHFLRLLPNEQTTGCIIVDITEDQTFQISSHGFNCRLSCGRVESVSSILSNPDPPTGRVLAAFDRSTSFGIGQSFNVCAQPPLDSDGRIQSFFSCDYKLKFTITEIPVP